MYPSLSDAHETTTITLSQARGHELAFRFTGSTAVSVQLSLFGERQFDNVVLFAQSLSGSETDKETVTFADIMGFIEDGGESRLVFVHYFLTPSLLVCFFFHRSSEETCL